MEIRIPAQQLEMYAKTNRNFVKGEIRAVALVFHGLNFTALRKDEDLTSVETTLGENGILTLFPYYGPWSWMNKSAVRYVDACVKSAMEAFSLPDGIPVLSSGGSMGGLSALIYTLYAARTPAACAANCPVCDLPYHFTERDDLPRTLLCAYMADEDSLKEALVRHSPLDQAANMPDIPYFIVHGDADLSVNKQRHSDRFVEAMKKEGRNIAYAEIPGMRHCDFASHPEAERAYVDFLISAAKG